HLPLGTDDLLGHLLFSAAYRSGLFHRTLQHQAVGGHQLRVGLCPVRIPRGVVDCVLLCQKGRGIRRDGRGDKPGRAPDRREIMSALRKFCQPALGLVLALGSGPVLAQATAAGAVPDKYRWLVFAVFGAIIAVTMYITYVAAKRTKTAADFYAAGGGMTGIQNGWAIAGDYLSAASFLGIAGLISLNGYDGFMYSVGWLVAYIT